MRASQNLKRSGNFIALKTLGKSEGMAIASAAGRRGWFDSWRQFALWDAANANLHIKYQLSHRLLDGG